jgi:hypothetical protein
MARNMYRCRSCLEWSAVQTDTRHADRRLVCGICGGTAEMVGAVRAGRVVAELERDACDAACMGARGTKCGCKCKGENHGAGLVTVVEVRDRGDASGVERVLAARTSVDVDTARARAAEWAATRDAVTAALEAAYPELGRYRAGEWLERPAFARYLKACEIRSTIARASKMTSQAGRLRKLAEAQALVDGSSECAAVTS